MIFLSGLHQRELHGRLLLPHSACGDLHFLRGRHKENTRGIQRVKVHWVLNVRENNMHFLGLFFFGPCTVEEKKFEYVVPKR